MRWSFHARWLPLAAIGALLLVPPADASAQEEMEEASMSESGTVDNALSAAPEQIARAAAVMSWEGEELRAGTNGWTCMPDVPDTPGNDPMCLDGAFVEWAQAWQARETPSIEKVGLAYMLQGGTDASNTDPYAEEPAPGEDWVEAGPHVMMVVPDPAALEGIPTDPDNGGPWVMWKGTPYAHIMMPVAR